MPWGGVPQGLISVTAVEVLHTVVPERSENDVVNVQLRADAVLVADIDDLFTYSFQLASLSDAEFNGRA